MFNYWGRVFLVSSYRTLVKAWQKASYSGSLLRTDYVTPGRRLVPAMRIRERVYAALAILGSFIGGAGLICLSIFDTKRYTVLHRVFLLVFILGVAISAIFTVIEVCSVASTPTTDPNPCCPPQYKWLSRDYAEVRKLRQVYVVKGVIATTLIVLAVAFTIAMYTDPDVGG